MNVFWQTIAGYNAATWPLQALLVVAGIVLTALLYRRPSPRVKVAMKVYLALLNGWIAVAYYLWACAERPYSGVMALFWGVMAAVWIYDIAVNYTTFERTRKHDRIAFVFYLMPFVYPLFSLLCHWALVGFSKIYFFGIPEDLLLASASVPALYLFFKEYIDLNFHRDTKPDLRVMNFLLAAMCTALGVFFSVTIWQQFIG